MIEAPEVVSRIGVTAANPPAAARIGARVLEEGGNAMDAAAAASLACCMLRPDMTGIGGYVCAAVVYHAATGSVWSVDANGVAPSAAHERMFRLRSGSRDPRAAGINELEYACSVEDDANVFGPLSVTVPGMMAGMGIIHERWGRLPWARIVAPSQTLLADGFPYRELLGAIQNNEKVLRRFPASVAHLMPKGTLPAPDELWHRPDMERTLAQLAEAGWRDFYVGRIGRTIADHLQAAGGILTREDMAAYQPRLTTPYTVNYRDAEVHCAILPNGGLSCLQALNFLECLRLPTEDTPEYWHLLAEVLKLAWRDRFNYVADPDFTNVAIARLLSKEYAAGRTETIRHFPTYVDPLVPVPMHEPPNGTLHVSTADAEGNLVAMTISQGGVFGSCLTVPDTGIILGHGMCRFDPRPGLANSVAANKRPLNNTGALLVRMPDRSVALGAPGGRKIISVMTRAAHLLVDRKYSGHQIATAPRLHLEGCEPVELQPSIDAAIIAAFQTMGHQPKIVAGICGVMNCAEYIKHDKLTRAGSDYKVTGAT